MPSTSSSILNGGRALWKDNRGGMAPLFALALAAIAGAATIGVDYARVVAMRQFLANAGDAAALAAVSRLPDRDEARSVALEYVEKNMPSAKYGEVLAPGDFEVGIWDSTTRTFTPAGPSEAAAAVRVTTRLSESNGNAISTLFAGVLGVLSVDLSAVSVAGRGGPPCVMVLDGVSTSAMSMGGSSSLEAVNCGVQVNSTANPALEMKGSSSLDASNICVGGTANTGGNAVEPDPNEFCPGQSDPLVGLPAPIYGGCNHHDASYHNSSATLLPGVYCGGLDIDGKSDITLSSGTYIIKDGPFALKGSAKVTGTDVTIFLTGAGAVVNMKAKTQVDLSAPTTGDLAGVLFFQDPAFGGIHDWKGKAATTLKGVIYFPEGTLESKNTNSITPEDSCTVLIAKNLEFQSNSGATIDISGSDCRAGLPGPYRRGIVLLQ